MSNKYKSAYTHPPLFLIDNIKLDWIPTKIRRLNKKLSPILLLVLQCLFQVFRRQAALLSKNCKIQLAGLLFLVVLDQLVTPFIWNFSEKLIERKKIFGYSPVSSVLLTKFGFSVSSLWSGNINKLTPASTKMEVGKSRTKVA